MIDCGNICDDSLMGFGSTRGAGKIYLVGLDTVAYEANDGYCIDIDTGTCRSAATTATSNSELIRHGSKSYRDRHIRLRAGSSWLQEPLPRQCLPRWKRSALTRNQMGDLAEEGSYCQLVHPVSA